MRRPTRCSVDAVPLAATIPRLPAALCRGGDTARRAHRAERPRARPEDRPRRRRRPPRSAAPAAILPILLPAVALGAHGLPVPEPAECTPAIRRRPAALPAVPDSAQEAVGPDESGCGANQDHAG